VQDRVVLECVVNVSEGARPSVVGEIAAAAGDDLLDVHLDAHHNRAVLTMVGERAPRAVTMAALARLDLRTHRGVHPRLGVVDVVPFVPLGTTPLADAVIARDHFAVWAAAELQLPCFLYGPERTLPDVRRRAWQDLDPDHGPPAPHLTAGAACVGARSVLVAYNVWLRDPDVTLARQIAAAVRGPHLRALGLAVGSRVQVSMNLVTPSEVGPADAYDAVARLAPVAGTELVGLVPRYVLHAIPHDRWEALDLAEDRTIEARLAGR
jgi:glutamate formiminotransferase